MNAPTLYDYYYGSPIIAEHPTLATPEQVKASSEYGSMGLIAIDPLGSVVASGFEVFLIENMNHRKVLVM